MSNFCCSDDFNGNQNFDFIDGRIHNAFTTMVLDGNEPSTISELLAGYNSIYSEAPLSEGDITVLPAKSCSDFNLNDNFDFIDGRIYNAFITMVLDGNKPTTVQELLNGYNSIYSGAQLADGDINHLPSLESDENIVTKDGVVPKCVEAEDKLWVAFTGNDHYTEWYEMETNEDEDFTKFMISAEAHPNVGKELQTWASDKTTNLQGILMTASPTRPSASSLTEDQKTKSFNSDLLKLNCDGTFNADHGTNDDQVNLRVQAYNNQNTPSLKKYGSEGSSHGYLASDKPWSGANMVYRTTTFSSIVKDDSEKNSIDIDYMYFIKETNENAKIKFSDSNPLNSTCDLFSLSACESNDCYEVAEGINESSLDIREITISSANQSENFGFWTPTFENFEIGVKLKFDVKFWVMSSQDEGVFVPGEVTFLNPNGTTAGKIIASPSHRPNLGPNGVMFLSKGTTCYKATFTSGGVDTRTYEEISANAPIKEGDTPNSFVYQLEEFCTLTT